MNGGKITHTHTHTIYGVTLRKENIMKSFNEWLKQKDIQENMADYTPRFIRRPLQKMGWMGSSTAERKKRAEDRARMDAEEMRKKQEDMERAKIHQNRREAEQAREKAQAVIDAEMRYRRRIKKDPRRDGRTGTPHDTRGY